jgi:hypothetical protein
MCLGHLHEQATWNAAFVLARFSARSHCNRYHERMIDTTHCASAPVAGMREALPTGASLSIIASPSPFHRLALDPGG